MSKTITTCAGIGDAIWLMQKLVNQPDAHNWIIPAGQPQRAHQLATLLPSVIRSVTFKEGLGYRSIKTYGYRGHWCNTPDAFMLEANTHLEAGKRIESFLPDLATSYRIQWETSDEDEASSQVCMGLAKKIVPSDYGFDEVGPVHQPPFIAIYTSAYQKDARWKGWEAKEWMEFIQLFPKGYTFVIIGASWDIGIPEQLMPMLTLNSIPYVNTVGQSLGVVIEVLKRCEAFIGFPSGLSILNETLGAGKTIMFFPPHLQAMQNTFAEPSRIEDGSFKACQWCTPEKLYSWIKENWKL